MRDFLSKRGEVEAVYYPDIDGEQLTSYGGILFLQLADPYREAYEDFKKALKLFHSGTGMACVTSMVAQPYSGSHASLNEEQKQGMGINRGLVRLCFGLESAADLEADLSQAFERLSSPVGATP
jgi:cystathionine gamma-lyase/cystathionine gamma-lyase/homocysteine desulfhydrase